MAVESRALKPLGATCNSTAANPMGGCASACCLNGVCMHCDKCAKNPTKDSTVCRWCVKRNKPISSGGCLLPGDSCSTRPGYGWSIKESKCSTGCCRDGKCTYCENCAMKWVLRPSITNETSTDMHPLCSSGGCKGCKSKKLPTNPAGTCAPIKKTTSKKGPVPTNAPLTGATWAVMPHSWCSEKLMVRMNGDDLQCEMNSLGTGCNWRGKCETKFPTTIYGWWTIPKALYTVQAQYQDWAILSWYATHGDSCAPYCPMWSKESLIDDGPDPCPAC